MDEKTSFEMTKRRSLIVWVYNLKQLKTLKRYGHIQFVSRRMKYVVIYMDESQVDEYKKSISKLHFVRSVEPSYRPDVEMNFADKIGTHAALQKEDDGFEVIEANTEIKLVENLS